MLTEYFIKNNNFQPKLYDINGGARRGAPSGNIFSCCGAPGNRSSSRKRFSHFSLSRTKTTAHKASDAAAALDEHGVPTVQRRNVRAAPDSPDPPLSVSKQNRPGYIEDAAREAAAIAGKAAVATEAAQAVRIAEQQAARINKLPKIYQIYTYDPCNNDNDNSLIYYGDSKFTIRFKIDTTDYKGINFFTNLNLLEYITTRDYLLLNLSINFTYKQYEFIFITEDNYTIDEDVNQIFDNTSALLDTLYEQIKFDQNYQTLTLYILTNILNLIFDKLHNNEKIDPELSSEILMFINNIFHSNLNLVYFFYEIYKRDKSNNTIDFKIFCDYLSKTILTILKYYIEDHNNLLESQEQRPLQIPRLTPQSQQQQLVASINESSSLQDDETKLLRVPKSIDDIFTNLRNQIQFNLENSEINEKMIEDLESKMLTFQKKLTKVKQIFDSNTTILELDKLKKNKESMLQKFKTTILNLQSILEENEILKQELTKKIPQQLQSVEKSNYKQEVEYALGLTTQDDILYKIVYNLNFPFESRKNYQITIKSLLDNIYTDIIDDSKLKDIFLTQLVSKVVKVIFPEEKNFNYDSKSIISNEIIDISTLTDGINDDDEIFQVDDYTFVELK